MTRPAESESGSVILVVEDEIELSRLFVEALGDAGFRVVPAYSVADALSSLASHTVDAAILDVELRDGPVFPVADQMAARGIPFFRFRCLLSSGSEAASGRAICHQTVQCQRASAPGE